MGEEGESSEETGNGHWEVELQATAPYQSIDVVRGTIGDVQYIQQPEGDEDEQTVFVALRTQV